MKIIFIRCVDDYDALEFSKEFKKTEYLRLWEEMKKYEIIRGRNQDYEGEALEFSSPIPKEFIDFIRNELIDYDMSKHQDFFIVEE